MERIITRESEANLPTSHGAFRVVVYTDPEGKEHTALVSGTVKTDAPTLVRMHSQCLTGDTFGSRKCDCGNQLDQALDQIARDEGVLVYLQQEGRNIGLANKIRAYNLQEEGMDTVEANEKLGFKPDQRDYTVGAQILADLGVGKIRLLTNNPRKIEGLGKYGLEIVERVPLLTESNPDNEKYLDTKRVKLGHLLEEKGVAK